MVRIIMSSLSDKIRESRKLEIVVDGVTFYGQRPSVDDFYSAVQKSLRDVQICKNHITGWDGMRESDLFPGASDDDVSFDAQLWADALPDCPHFYTPLAKALFKATTDFIAERGKQEKNSRPGSKPGK